MTLALPIIATIIAVGWAFYSIFIKYASEFIHPILGLSVVSLTVFILTSLICLGLKINDPASLTFTTKGLIFSILAGLFVMIPDSLFFYLFSQKAELGYYMSFIGAATLLVTVTFGIVFLGEKINLQILAGFAFCILGVALLSRA